MDKLLYILFLLQGVQLNILNAISLFGVIQGIVIAGSLLFNKKYTIPTKRYIIMLLLVCVNINFFELLNSTKILNLNIPIWILPVSFFPLIIPAAYFIAKYYLNSELNIKPWEKIFYIPFIITIFFELYTTIQYFNGSLSAKEVAYGSTINRILLGLELISAITVAAVCSYYFFRIRKNKEKIYTNAPAITPENMTWIITSLLGGLILGIVSIYAASTELSNESYELAKNPHDRTGLQLGITIVIYWFVYGIVMHPNLFKDNKKHLIGSEEELEEQKNIHPFNKLSDNTDIYHDRLLSFMQEKAPYRDPDFNLEKLAQEINISKSYVSKIINTKEGKNFFEFVNYYRVEEVKKRLLDESFDHFNIIAIALEAGFKSKSTFNTAFKKMTGMSPSKFKKSKRKK